MSLNKRINLQQLSDSLEQIYAEQLKVRINADSFCGLVVKTGNSTILVYESGKIIIIGSKDTNSLEQVIRNIYSCAENVLLMPACRSSV